jgi:hypothetical protein
LGPYLLLHYFHSSRATHLAPLVCRMRLRLGCLKAHCLKKQTRMEFFHCQPARERKWNSSTANACHPSSGLIFLLQLGGRRRRLRGRGLLLHGTAGADLVLRAKEEHVGGEVRRLQVGLGPGHGGRCGERVVDSHPLLLLNPQCPGGHQRSGAR